MKLNAFEQFQKLSQQNLADRAWLARTKRILIAHMDAHPRQQPASVVSWLFSRTMVRTFSIAAVVLLMVIGITEVTLAAQESIPGDTLYSWKVGVENIQSVFIVGTQSRAEFEVQRTTKRLQEVTELAVRKPAATMIAQEAHQRLQAQINVAAEEITKVASEDPQKALDTALTLQSTLQAHKDVLDQLAPKVASDTMPQIQNALDAIKENSNQVGSRIQDLRVQTQDDLVATRATETIKADADAKLEETKKSIDSLWDLISQLPEGSMLRDEAQAKIEGAQDALSDAHDAFAKAAYDDTMIALQSSSQLLSETTALLEVTQNVGVAVKEILDTSITPTPSAIVSAIPSTSPTLSSHPTATPTAIPLPPILSISLNKSRYVPTEVILVTIKATNPSTAPLTMHWSNGCQVDAAIDDYPILLGYSCFAEATAATIPGQQSYPWVLVLTAPRDIGTHIMNAEVFGYGKVDVKFDVTEETALP